MRILFVGDVVGKAGRRTLKKNLGEIQRQEAIDLTVVNVENSAGGFGITGEIGQEILELGVDVMTSGNHIWDKREVLSYIEQEQRLLRPGNYPPGTPGKGFLVVERSDLPPVAVINLQGRVFMPMIDCPFQWLDRELGAIRDRAGIVLVDFHAEATSEKMAIGWFLDGRVSAVVGTHTHVPTADARILPGGTAFISDVGMTGPIRSIIGMKIEPSVQRFMTGRNTRFEVARGATQFASVIIEVDDETGKASSIRSILV